MIAIACDHSALEMKNEVEALLDEMGLAYHDYGTYTAESCDYPVFGVRAAKAVAAGECERGIVICGTGIGISLTANKVKGIRCALCSEPYSAELTPPPQRRQYAGAGRPCDRTGARQEHRPHLFDHGIRGRTA